jgi:diguanylate cyclase (GGDEF)-like protein
MLVEAMIASRKKGIAIASRPFTLAENFKGYVIHRAIKSSHMNRGVGLNYDYYGLLVIATDKLFALDKTDSKLSYISVLNPSYEYHSSDEAIVYEVGSRAVSKAFSAIFPVLSFKKSLSDQIPSQPFTIESQYQLTWSDLSYKLIAAILIAMLLVPLLTRTYMMKFLFEEISKIDDKEELYQLANFDSLTGLPNRVRLFDHVEMLIAKGSRKSVGFTLFFIDLDNFKPVNDKHGHAVGDYVLHEFSARLAEHIRENELLARLGGDEFILIVENEVNEATVEIIENRIQKLFVEPITYGENQFYLKFSIGSASYPLDGKNIQALLEKADQDMYAQKTDKQNNLHLIS